MNTKLNDNHCLFLVQKSRGNVEFDFTQHYKSLDDVSLHSQCDVICSQSNASVTFKTSNQKLNCDDRKLNITKLLQCDKTPVKTKNNFHISKKELQCENCGFVGSNGITIDNKRSNKQKCYSKDEYFSNNVFSDTSCRQITNSTNSLGHTFNSCKNVYSIIRKRIVFSQFLLESFGNASNQINSNSSRFVSCLTNDSFLIFIKQKLLLILGKLF